MENGGFINKVGKGGANHRNGDADENYQRSKDYCNARVAHIHKNKCPVSDEEKSGIESGKGGNCFKVFCVIETEGIIVSDIFGYFPAEEKGNETEKFVRRERYAGSMCRTFYVGEDVKQEDIRAKYESGVLRLSIPKKEEKKAQIEDKKYIAIEG